MASPGAAVRELVFALEFRGHGRAVPGVPGAREARTTASPDTLVAFAGGEWLRGHMDEGASLEARVQRYDDGTFVEAGAIRYGDGAVRFETVGRGWVAPGPAPGFMAGGVLWRVTDGEGWLAHATGLITSNFTVGAAGDVVDHHVARIYVPLDR